MIEERPEDVVCLLNNPEAVQVVAVWGKLVKPFDVVEISTKTGISQRKVEIILEVLKGNNCVDDKGNVNIYASQYIKSLVAKRLKGKK